MMHLKLLASVWISSMNYVSSMASISEETSINKMDVSCPSHLWTSIRSNISQYKVIFPKYPELQESYLASGKSIRVFASSDRNTAEPLRTNLRKKTLTVGILIWPLVASYDRSRNKYTGFCIDILEEISQRLNFTYELTQPEDGQWGAKKNGTWNGLIEKLVTKEYDIVAAPLTKQRDREAAINMVCPISRDEIRIWILDPKIKQKKSFIIFDLMDTRVCVVLFAVYVGVVVVYALMDMAGTQMSPGTCLNQTMLHVDKSCMVFLRSLLRQGSTDLPERNSRRSIVALWWWFSILSSIIYSGTVIATLADSTPVYPFTTIDGMLKQNIYKYGIVGSSIVETLLQESKSVHLRNLLESVRRFAQEDPTVMSKDINEHYRKIDNEKYAFIGAIKNAPAQYISLKDELVGRWSCLGLPNNSTLTEPVKQVLDDLMAHGILQALWKRYGVVRRRSSFDDVRENTNSDQFDLDVLYSAFVMLVVGILLSVLILLFEIALCALMGIKLLLRLSQG